MPETKATPENEEQNDSYKDEWMLRPCEFYKEEYNDCKCYKARFHQYFIYGEYLDCSQWKEDYNNCYKWKKYKSKEAFDKLVSSEKQHRRERLQGHYQNDVWQRRDKPPENWNSPLPDWLQEKAKTSFLTIVKDKCKQDVEMKNVQGSSCVLM